MRAQREAQRQWERERTAEIARPKPKARSPLESEWGEMLDRLSNDEANRLLDRAELSDFERALATRHGRNPAGRFGPVRGKLLEVLAAQHSEEKP